MIKHHKKSSRFMLVGLMSLLLISPAWTQMDDIDIENLSLTDLLNLTLTTGSFLELDLSKAPLAMTLISRDKISISGGRNISEVLEIYVPGFQYSYNKWNGVVWGMRGVMNDRNTKFIVLVNGHKMNTEARDGFIQETVLPGLNEIERIEALRGPAGLVYGSGAIAGIINIVTRSGDTDVAELTSTVGSWGSFDKYSATVQGFVQEAPSEDFKFSLYGAASNSTGQGNNKTMIYGADSWPYPTWETHDASNGVLSNGSAMSNPGSWKVGGTFEAKKLSGQARLTHQVQNVGGMMIADMWPHSFGVENNRSGGSDIIGWVNGLPIDPSDNPYSVIGIREKQTKGREYVSDNIMADLVWTEPLGANELKFKLSFDGNTNRIQYMDVPGSEVAGQLGLRSGYILETSGEKRYTAGLTWLMKNISDLQLALGFESRLDDIGKDLSGQNYMSLFGNQTTRHLAITDVMYKNHALFMESMYDFNSALAVALGGRWDGHTRTIKQGGTVNGKFAFIVTPAEGHSIKLIAQTSTNNATADNYEYNRQFYDDFGKIITGPMFENSPTQKAESWSPVYVSPTLTELRSIKPERTISFEAISTHEIDLGDLSFFVSPGASYNIVKDLLAWDNNIFRVRNTSDYQFVNAEMELEFKSPWVDVGVNHAYQIPVKIDLDKTEQTLTKMGNAGGSDYFVETTEHGIQQYYPKDPVEEEYTYNSVKELVSYDGKYFLNLNTHLTKVYADFKVNEFIKLHSSLRIFWGYQGRKDRYEDIDKNSTNYGGDSKFTWLDVDTKPIVKMNVGTNFVLSDSWELGVFAYDLLAGKYGSAKRNALRSQVIIDGNTNGLYSIDNTSYAVKLTKSF